MKNLYLLIMIVLISACSSTGKKAVDKMYYRFPEPVASLINHKQALIIKRPTALGILANRPMVAQNEDGGLTQMQHNFWLESPKTLLQNYLNKIFLGLSEDVSKSSILNVQILHFEKKQQQAILELKFEVKNQAHEIIFSKIYIEQKEFSENSIPNFVKSMFDLLNEMVQQFINDLP